MTDGDRKISGLIEFGVALQSCWVRKDLGQCRSERDPRINGFDPGSEIGQIGRQAACGLIGGFRVELHSRCVV